MKNILIYFPYNHRAVEPQSVMEMLVKKGHSVFLLTLLPEDYLHEYVRKLGVQVFASPVTSTSKKSIVANARYLISFCKKYKIDIIIAHQQLCALPLILARNFIKARPFYIRHNADEDYLKFPRKAKIMNRFINRMLPDIIAPSDIVYRYMVDHEKVNPKKMRRINYGYNFLQYDRPDPEKVAEVRAAYPGKLLVVSIARLVPAKRHKFMFAAIKEMVDRGRNIKMICLGDGPLNNELKVWVTDNKLSHHIFFAGMQQHIFNYLAAADLLLHLSETEASNSVVKESGLTKKTVIVCERVGDFSDYIVHGENGFLVNKENPVAQTVEILDKLYYNEKWLFEAGQKLHQTIVNGFDINNVSLQYDELIN